MITNYEIDFSIDTINTNIKRLTNQLWKLIPMRENNEDWNKQLITVIIEIAGLSNIFIAVPQFLQLLSKLEGLSVKAEEIPFEIYRKTIFESISLLQEISHAIRI